MSLSKFFGETANVAREIILHPAFNTKELNTYCSKRKQGLTIERQKIDVQSRELFGKALFGECHPYGISSHESEYDNITREDLIALYNELYTAENCFVVCPFTCNFFLNGCTTGRKSANKNNKNQCNT